MVDQLKFPVERLTTSVTDEGVGRAVKPQMHYLDKHKTILKQQSSVSVVFF